MKYPATVSRQPSLRPGDVAVALALALRPAQAFVPLAEGVGISLGEAHNAVRRLRAARLLRPDERRPAARALLDFVVSGVPYVFPGVLGPDARGVPTAWSAPPLAEAFRGADAVVWPSGAGTMRGQSLTPLYPGAPALARARPDLYELLALVDALRIGRARERGLATAQLRKRLSA